MDNPITLSKDQLDNVTFDGTVIVKTDDDRTVTIQGTHKHNIGGIPILFEGATVGQVVRHAVEFIIVRKTQALIKAMSIDADGTYRGDAVATQAISSLRETGLKVASIGMRRQGIRPPMTAAEAASRTARACKSLKELDDTIAFLEGERDRKFQING